MSDTQNLYFIALLPDEELRLRVKSLKEEIRDNYGAKHAIKSPVHITLIPPFRREASHERFITDALQRFSSIQIPFEISLSNFNSFPPRVIYIDVLNQDKIRDLHSSLRKFLVDQMLFHPDDIKKEIHPHMTLATRDLTQEAYHKAWHEFKNRSLQTNFVCNSVFLLKHNGKFWDVFAEYPFNNAH